MNTTTKIDANTVYFCVHTGIARTALVFMAMEDEALAELVSRTYQALETDAARYGFEVSEADECLFGDPSFVRKELELIVGRALAMAVANNRDNDAYSEWSELNGFGDVPFDEQSRMQNRYLARVHAEGWNSTVITCARATAMLSMMEAGLSESVKIAA